LEDVPLLVNHFLQKQAGAAGGEPKKIDPKAVDILCHYDYPGNVRELENAIERAVVLSRGDALGETDLPDHIATAAASATTQLTFEIGTTLDEIELRVIRETLRHTKGDKSVAAQLLGISTRTIYRKLDGVTE
jgi:two-component system response regulator HydG